jgi:hypothetical protein
MPVHSGLGRNHAIGNQLSAVATTLLIREETMTVPSSARVFVSVHEGKVEIEGSEEFVKDQLARVQEVVAQIVSAQKAPTEDAAIAVKADLSSLGKYAKLFNTAPNGKIELLKDLPGNNMAHKTVSAALLVSYANSLMGSEQTPLDEIRKTCKEHDCHDSNNFSATIKREKDLFVHSGCSTIRLSDAGRQLAQNLAEQLVAA